MRTRRSLLLALLGGPLLAAGCIYGSDAPWLAEGDRPALQVTGTSPAAGASGVPRTGAVTFRFDDRVHPDCVGGDTVTLTSGEVSVGASRQVDLLACTVSLVPQAPLVAALTYQAEARDLHGFSRGPMTGPIAVGFTTGDASEPASPPDAPGTEEVVAMVFLPRCAGCHGDYRPPRGLSLTSAEAVNATLLGRDSVDRPGSPLVSRGSHARSYLLWKLLDLPGIAGTDMPPSHDWGGGRQCGNPHPDLARLARWIDGLPAQP